MKKKNYKISIKNNRNNKQKFRFIIHRRILQKYCHKFKIILNNLKYLLMLKEMLKQKKKRLYKNKKKHYNNNKELYKKKKRLNKFIFHRKQKDWKC